jgi:hypothetical protein
MPSGKKTKKPKKPKKMKKTKARPKSKTTGGKKKSTRKASSRAKSLAKGNRQSAGTSFSRRRAARGAGQAGDLQGVSRGERADSESVDELLEEGNAFEAGVVAGVQHADDTDEQEVHTREVPEDDVPDEYLDKDS